MDHLPPVCFIYQADSWDILFSKEHAYHNNKLSFIIAHILTMCIGFFVSF